MVLNFLIFFFYAVRLNSEFIKGKDLPQCDCVGACDNNIYGAMLSYNNLQFMPPSDLNNLNEKEVWHTYIKAQEAQMRVGGSDMSTLLEDLINVGELITDINSLFSLHVFNPSVSVFTRVRQGAEEATMMLESDLNVTFAGIENYMSSFESAMKYVLIKLRLNLSQLQIAGRDLIQKLWRVKSSHILEIESYEPALESVEYLREIVRGIDKELGPTSTYLKINQLLPGYMENTPKNLVYDRIQKEECDEAPEKLQKLFKCLHLQLNVTEQYIKQCQNCSGSFCLCLMSLDGVPDVFPVESNVNQSDLCFNNQFLHGWQDSFDADHFQIGVVDRLLYKIEYFIPKLDDCYSELDIFFTDITEQLKEVSWPFLDLSSDLDYLKNFRTLSHANNLLAQYFEQYTSMEITTLDLAYAIKAASEEITESVESLEVAISQRLAGPVYDNMNELKALLVKKYTWAIQASVKFTTYYPGNMFLQENIRSADVWRIPVPNLQSPQILEYKLPSSAYNLAISHGVGSHGGALAIENMQLALSNYFNSLSSSVSNVTTELGSMRSKVNNALAHIISTLTSYASQVDSSKNFFR